MRAMFPAFAGLVLPLLPACGWEPGDTNATSGLSVDTGRRNDVVSFWHSIYTDSEGYEERIGWTGNYASCNAGTTAREFQDDVQRRINFVRALAGIPAEVLVNDGTTVFVDSRYNPPPSTLRSTAAQEAALMIARTGVVSHVPPVSLPCFTSPAGNGCARSSLAYAFFGPAAIDEYMRETSALGDTVWSAPAGHRRWILYPGATVFASGDTPGNPNTAATNVLYCVPTEEELVKVPAGFTAWPAAGHFPDGLNTVLWSLSHPDADFSQASVSMTGPGGAVNVAIIDRTTTAYGEPAIIWQVPASVGVGSVAADTAYQVVVTGLQGPGVPASHSYQVTLIDPDTLNEPLELVGSAAPPAGGARYSFQSVDMADDHSVDVSQLVSPGWTEGAEDTPPPRVVDGTAAGYELRASMTAAFYGDFWRTGDKSFRLAFDEYLNPPIENEFIIDRELVTGGSPQLSFHYKRGYMASGTALQVETSIDGGVSWQPTGSAVTGRLNGTPDNDFTLKTVPLPANASAVRVRFSHLWNGGSIYTIEKYPTQPVGIFIDDITVSDVQELQSIATVSLGAEASSFWFDSSSAGRTLVAGESYRLRLRATMDRHQFPYGPTRELTVTGSPLGGYAAWQAYEQPLLAGGFDDDDDGDGLGNGAEYAFRTDPLARSLVTGTLVADRQAALLRFSRPLESPRSDVGYGAEWSADMANWSSEGVSVSFANGALRAEAPMAGERRFLRWRISRN